MHLKLLLLCLTLTSIASSVNAADADGVSFGGLDDDDGEFKAVAVLTRDDCNCQCSRLVYASDGRSYGNCKTQLKGKEWCYVIGGARSPCLGLRRARTFRGQYWSFHACATPARTSRQCRLVLGRGGGGGGGGGLPSPTRDVPVENEIPFTRTTTTTTTTRKPSVGGSFGGRTGPVVDPFKDSSGGLTDADFDEGNSGGLGDDDFY